MFHRNDNCLLAGHGIHILQSLQKPDLHSSLNIQYISSLAIQTSAFQISTSRYNLTLDFSFSFGNKTQILTQQPRQLQILQIDFLHIHTPNSRHLQHILRYPIIDFQTLDQQILQHLHPNKCTYYPQMVLMVT